MAIKIHVEVGEDLAKQIDNLVRLSGASGRPEVVRRLCRTGLREIHRPDVAADHHEQQGR